jgi:hypothetical protein
MLPLDTARAGFDHGPTRSICLPVMVDAKGAAPRQSLKKGEYLSVRYVFDIILLFFGVL